MKKKGAICMDLWSEEGGRRIGAAGSGNGGVGVKEGMRKLI